jgi:hypothetical protein
MTHRILRHLRNHAISYVALFFAVGGGGVGAAVAATAISSPSVHACVSRKTGALFIAKRCGRTTKALVFNQRGPTGEAGAAGAAGAAGTPATVAWAYVSSDGNSTGQGISVSETSAGQYSLTVTATQCAGTAIEAPVVTPNGNPTASGTLSGIPDAYAASTPGSETFTVTAGFIQNSNFVAGNEGFAVQDQCGS